MANNFRYTLDNPKLSLEQRRFYEENGYILIKNLIDHNVLDQCLARFLDICEGRSPPQKEMTLMKDVSLKDTNAKGEFLYYKIQDINYDDVFSKYFAYNKLLDYVECFTGPTIRSMHTMLINKPPDSGKKTSAHPLHQDLHYFSFRPVDRIVAAWTAMERITDHNGCLVVIPGTHKGQLLKHDYPDWQGGVNKAFHGIRGYELVPTVKLHMDKGDTVFFHPLLIHGSGPNFSKGCRKAISCHYATTEFHHIDIKGTSQENIGQEVEAIAAKKGYKMDFRDLWDIRSKVVRDKPKSAL